MARQRMLHPDFFTDPKVVRCSAFARLLFQGLWCLADREGRLEADPLALKLRLLPADNCDIEALLVELEAQRLVVRYGADGRPLVYLPGFTKRQRPHPKEPKSELPGPTAAPEQRQAVERNGEPRKDTTKPSESFPSESESFPSESESEKKPEWPVAELPPARLREVVPLVVAKPTTPPEAWTGDDFWQWAQFKRQEAGFVAETRRPRDLGGWYSTALMTLGGDVERLQEAFYRFGEDRHWQAAKPALPFSAFVSQWTDFVPRKVAQHA